MDTERKNSSPVSTMIPHGELLLDLMYEYDKYSVLLQGRGVFDQANGVVKIVLPIIITGYGMLH